MQTAVRVPKSDWAERRHPSTALMAASRSLSASAGQRLDGSVCTAHGRIIDLVTRTT